jgi:hypothetical protein
MDIGGPPLPAAMTWQAAAWRHKGEDCDDKRYGKNMDGTQDMHFL